MTVWYFVLMLLFIFSIFEVCGQKNVLVARNVSFDSIVFFYLAALLLLLTAFQFDVGVDQKNYIFAFRHIGTMQFEPGYKLINVFFYNLKLGDKGFFLMQFVLMTFCCGVVFTNIYKNNEFPIFILLIYFSLFYFDVNIQQLRQHIAISVLICGNKFIYDRKILLWFLVVVVAMQFHLSAFMAFPLYFTDRIHLPIIIVFACICITLFLNLFGYNLIWKVLDFFVYLNVLPDRLVNMLTRYMNSKVLGQQGQFSTGIGLLIRYVFYFIFAFLLKFKKYEEYEKYHIVNFLIGLFFFSLGRNFDQFARISNYYLICGNGLSFYNILPSKSNFFKHMNYVKVCFSGIFLVLIAILESKRFLWDNNAFIYNSFLFMAL